MISVLIVQLDLSSVTSFDVRVGLIDLVWRPHHCN